MKNNTRAVGKELEDYIFETLKFYYPDIKQTKNSGANICKSDIVGSEWRIECKVRNTPNLTIEKKVWDKLVKQLKNTQRPVLFMQNSEKDRFVVLKLNDFEDLIKGYTKNEKSS